MNSHKRMKRLEKRVMTHFNECQEIEGDWDLKTNTPNDPFFLYWASINPSEEAEEYINLRGL